MMRRAFLVLILVAITAACSGRPTISSTKTPVMEIISGELEEEPQIVPSETAAPTPTVDARLLPEDWQNWPVIPDLTATARAIYEKGLQMGNDAHAFSKIGDCQNLKSVFLWKYDHLDIYQFDWDISPYLDTIENFQGYFDRDGQSAQYGFTAASPLTQIQADPKYCQPDETPMECELRTTRPTFVLISLEFPFNGRTADLYEQYLRRIIEYSMAQGVVPILATKADNVEKDDSINLTVARLAYEYDLPLWNWWAAAQPLADHGIDPYRDSFHISEQAWEERSKTFLQVLDHLWKQVNAVNQ
ncbi:MAG: hypothetical protein GYA45_05375 [Pelolinea sp.]|jgi:hypothetical protein|nr:hypothetical protein [Pelolinea sp.]